jgi:hypothetical protein
MTEPQTQRTRYAHLPEPVDLDETITSQDTSSAPDPEAGRDTDRELPAALRPLRRGPLRKVLLITSPCSRTGSPARDRGPRAHVEGACPPRALRSAGELELG